ncbi:hypothetical protein TcWFU_006247 [Taenia crassiceps]|uniref:Apple domain-containing protein n=1 Tax=Taenia crassiceps TaxID=6207 RepID=A0ABR4QHH3_9CEST
MSVDDCLTACCSTTNCTTIAYYEFSRKCILYNCGDPNFCIRTGSSTGNVFYIERTSAENEMNPFWSRLASQSRKQTALTIGVLAAIAFVFLASLGVCLYLRCSRRRGRGSGHLKHRNKRIRGVGGPYHIIFNSEGEEPLPNGNNTLF